MDEESDLQEKTENPSSKRVEDFRQKGDVVYSKELGSILMLTASFSLILLGMVYVLEQFSTFFNELFSLDLTLIYSQKGRIFVWDLIKNLLLKSLFPFLILLMLVGIFSSLSQFGFLFSPSIMNINWSKINPINGIKRIFSKNTIVEFFKSIAKFLLVLGIVFFTFKSRLIHFQGLFDVSPLESFLLVQKMMVPFISTLLMALATLAALDFFYQKWVYDNRLKTTKEEAKQELKEQEGNPEIKQRIRKIQREMAKKRIASDVKSADVIITNPTHLSVAIKYDKDKMIAPKVVAKGSDYLALRIREMAKEYNIPIVENKPLAQKMYFTIKKGEYVPPSLYKALAQVLAFVYRKKESLKKSILKEIHG